MSGALSTKKVWLFTAALIAVVQFFILNLTHHYQQQVYQLHLQQEASSLFKTIEQNIEEKQLATTAIGLALSLDVSDLQVSEPIMEQGRLKRLIKK